MHLQVCSVDQGATGQQDDSAGDVMSDGDAEKP
jgi:hypothetical protein